MTVYNPPNLSGYVPYNNATQITPQLGSVSDPIYSFTGDTNTGMFSTGADTIGFATNGVNRVTIGSSGNVGIGTGSPSKKLHIYGTDNAIRLTYPSAADWDMNVNSSGTFGLFPNNGSSVLSVTTSGNVGIGTTLPTTRLNVIGDSSTIDSGFIVSSHTLTNNTNKYGGFTVPHYNNSVRADIMGFWVSAQSSITELLVGGGFGGKLSPTSIYFYTSTNNTSSGSIRGRFDASGRFALGTHTPVYMFDLINTGTSQHRIGYSATQYLDTRVFSSGGVGLTANGTVPYIQLSAGSSWLQQSQYQVSIYNSSGFLGVQGDDSGSYFGSGVWTSSEHGVYSLNGDETIATYDWNTYQFYYFNRALYGDDSNIYTNSLFYPLQLSSAPTYQEGAIYYDTTLHKLRIGGASGWETITSI